MEFDLEAVLKALAHAEQDISDCQNLIDNLRSTRPNDQEFQLEMDFQQYDLDKRKKRVRDVKHITSKLTM